MTEAERMKRQEIKTRADSLVSKIKATCPDNHEREVAISKVKKALALFDKANFMLDEAIMWAKFSMFEGSQD